MIKTSPKRTTCKRSRNESRGKRSDSQISANYKRIERDYPVYSGKEFWLHLTGDESFYEDLIDVFSDCAKDYSDTNLLDVTIEELAGDIVKHPEVLSYDDVYEGVSFDED